MGLDKRIAREAAPVAGADSEVNIRSSSYFLMRTVINCWKCNAPTPVVGFGLPAGHYMLERDADDGSAPLAWEVQDMPATISYVDYLPPAIAARARQLAPGFRRDFSATARASYYMNHCDDCGVKQGDFQLHSEPGVAFLVTNEAEASNIELLRFDEAFVSGHGSYHYDIDFIDYMKTGSR